MGNIQIPFILKVLVGACELSEDVLIHNGRLSKTHMEFLASDLSFGSFEVGGVFLCITFGL